MKGKTMNAEELLVHADFVRRLSQSLVFDEHGSADVAQDTLLAAWERPPAEGSCLRAWLAKVTRNVAANLRKKEFRRDRRERAASLPMEAPSPESIVEREEIRRRVIEAVLALKEPYRSTVLLRYYEDRTSREIAEGLHVSLETVRTRLKRGLEQLRRRLDAVHGGDRKTWCLALTPLCGAKLSSSAAGSAAALTGTFLATTKMKIAAAVVLVLGLAVGVWRMLPDEPGIDVLPPSLSMEEPLAQRDAAAPNPLVGGNAPAEENAKRAAPSREILKPDRNFIAGRITDKVTGEPVKTFHIQLDLHKGRNNERIVDETFTHEEGRFSIPFDEGGDYNLSVFSSRYRRFPSRAIHVDPDEKSRELCIEMDPGLSLSGRVVEDATSRPVKDALVCVMHDWRGYRNLIHILIENRPEHVIHARTDEKGHFIVQGLPENLSSPKFAQGLPDHFSSLKVVAVHPDWPEGAVKVEPGSDRNVEIRLKKGFRVFGKALDDHGRPAAGLLITMHGYFTPLYRPVLTGPDGRFQCPPALPGDLTVTAGTWDDAIRDKAPFTREMKHIVLEDRDVEVLFGPVPDSVTWRGRLIDFTGDPLGGVKLRMSLVPSFGTREYGGGEGFSETDEEGRFEIRKLTLGTHDVNLYFPTQECSTEWEDVTFDSPGLVERDIRLPGSKGVLAGVVRVGKRGGSFRPSEEEDFRIRASLVGASPPAHFDAFVNEAGRFCLRNIPAGRYSLRTLSWKREPIEPLEVEVWEGRVTKDIVIQLSAMGTLRVEFVDFSDQEIDRLNVVLKKQDGSEVFGFEPRDMLIGTGTWEFHIIEQGMISPTRSFRIEEGKTTEITINRSELALSKEDGPPLMEEDGLSLTGEYGSQVKDQDGMPLAEEDSSFDGPYTVPGLLKQADGSPVAGARLSFTSPRRLLGGEGKVFECTTNANGGFVLEGFKRDFWSVSCTPRDGVTIELPKVVFDPSRPQARAGERRDEYLIFSHFIELTLPTGKVKGIFCDKRTGLPLGEEVSEWTVRLKDMKTGRRGKISCRRKGKGEFLLSGVPEGEYRLEAHIRECEEFESEPFVLKPGQTVDFGKIALEPMGVLDLEIKTPEGEPVTSAIFSCQGKIPKYGITDFDNVRYVVYRLPLGQVDVKVVVQGFVIHVVSALLEPFRPAEASIVLRRK